MIRRLRKARAWPADPASGARRGMATQRVAMQKGTPKVVPYPLARRYDQPWSVADSYRSLRAIYSLNARMSLLHGIEGVDLSRCFEYAKASEFLTPLDAGRVLDVGSYRSPFTAFMADLGHQVTVIDLDPVVGRQKEWVRKALRREGSLSASVADATCLPFRDDAFSSAVCISTVEHIPRDGDVRAIAEIGRVLKRGGYCFISVPYSNPSREGSWGRWFQRWYDLPTATERLVAPSGLSLGSYGFLMGGVIGRMADIWYSLPRLLRHALSWSHILLFPQAFHRDMADENDARALWLLLEKS